MKKCWAAKLGGCCDTISREHLVSACLYDQDAIAVRGLSWCKDKECTIGLSSLTSKMLCRKHNYDLHSVDEEGAKAFKTLSKLKKQLLVRQKMQPRRWKKTAYKVNGLMLERWFLKTGMNLVYYDRNQLKEDDETPTVSLLRVIYGEEKMEPHAGLYITFSSKQTFTSHNTIEFSVLSDETGWIVGYRFTFQDFRFLVSLMPKKINSVKSDEGKMVSESWSNSELIYHPRKINIKQGDHISQVVNFTW